MTSVKTRFTKRELRAIEEALNARLAGPIDIEKERGAPRRVDYDCALSKVERRLELLER